MITSPEFGEKIATQHSTFQIIDRISAVFLGRCSTSAELEKHLESLKDDQPGEITTWILREARLKDAGQIFKGGYPPSRCSRL